MFKSIKTLASQKIIQPYYLEGKKKQQCPTFLDAITTTTSKHYCFINPIPLMHLLILVFFTELQSLKNFTLMNHNFKVMCFYTFKLPHLWILVMKLFFSYPISFFYKLPISSFLVITLAIMWSQENYLLATCKKMKLDKKKLTLMWSQCIIWFKKFVLVVFIGQRG
jgi:hypothetical protein